MADDESIAPPDPCRLMQDNYIGKMGFSGFTFNPGMGDNTDIISGCRTPR
jgi:hypothetical protein